MVDYIDESIGYKVERLFDLDAEFWSKSVPSLPKIVSMLYFLLLIKISLRSVIKE